MQRMDCGRYDSDNDPTGWWASEKLDGWGAVWTGSKLVTRSGKALPCMPPGWDAGLPAGIALDGEIHAGHGNQHLVAAAMAAHVMVNEAKDYRLWAPLQFAVFDIIEADRSIEDRLGMSEAGVLGAHIDEAIQFARNAGVIRYTRITSQRQLAAQLRGVETMGGEGIVLTRPGSEYIAGRSKDRLKVKSQHDADFEVLDVTYKKGKPTLRILSALGEEGGLSHGVPLGDVPEIGAIITVRSEGFTHKGLPRFGAFVRVRRDGVSEAPRRIDTVLPE